MYGKIKDIFLVSNPNYNEFLKELLQDIKKLQDGNQAVEIEYDTGSFIDKSVTYSALVIGREKEDKIIRIGGEKLSSDVISEIIKNAVQEMQVQGQHEFIPSTPEGPCTGIAGRKPD